MSTESQFCENELCLCPGLRQGERRRMAYHLSAATAGEDEERFGPTLADADGKVLERAIP